MSAINQTSLASGEQVFTVDEIRVADVAAKRLN